MTNPENISSLSSAKNEKTAELRDWFELVLELQSQEFTPQQVRSALADQNSILKKSSSVSNGFVANSKNNNPWCF